MYYVPTLLGLQPLCWAFISGISFFPTATGYNYYMHTSKQTCPVMQAV